MKRIFFAIILVTGLVATYSFAQMSGGMMGTDKGGHGSMMEGQHQHGDMGQGMMEKDEHMMDYKGMMSHENMTGNMMEMMHQMSDMMHDMGGKMVDMPKDKMHNMSGMMRDMCTEMNRMSGMMDSGMANEKDMNAMHERMNEMQKKMSGMMK
jgi:hypothetical protein